MRNQTKKKKQAKETISTALVEAATPVKLSQSGEKREDSHYDKGDNDVEQISSSKKEGESNLKPSQRVVIAAPLQSGVDPRYWVVPNYWDYYIDQVALNDQGNKKRSLGSYQNLSKRYQSWCRALKIISWGG